MFIVQVAAVSWAATHVPESKMANHSFRYSGFRSAEKVEVLLGQWFIGLSVGRAGARRKPDRFIPGSPSWIASRAVSLALA